MQDGGRIPGEHERRHDMNPRILINYRRRMLLYWPYRVWHPRWGLHHGTNGVAHSMWVWCIQIWWTDRTTKGGTACH